MGGRLGRAERKGQRGVSTRLVKGTAVVSITDGTKLGTVDHVYLDPASKQIVEFTFHTGGFLGGRSSGVVDVSDVHSIGQDAVTLADASAVRSGVAVNPRCGDLVDLEELLKRKVMTEGGTYVGQVAAVEFGQDSHRLLRIEVSPGSFKHHETIPAEEIVSIGAELVVISDAIGVGIGATVGAGAETTLVVGG